MKRLRFAKSVHAHPIAWCALIGVAIFLPDIATILGELVVVHGKSVSVRLDTGDQQYHWYGIEIGGRPMADPYRNELLAISEASLQDRYEWCAQEVGSNHADLMVYDFYRNAAAWVQEDPEIARVIVRDLAEYLHSTHATHGLPACYHMISPLAVKRPAGIPKVVEGWREDPAIKEYLSSKTM